MNDDNAGAREAEWLGTASGDAANPVTTPRVEPSTLDGLPAPVGAPVSTTLDVRGRARGSVAFVLVMAAWVVAGAAAFLGWFGVAGLWIVLELVLACLIALGGVVLAVISMRRSSVGPSGLAIAAVVIGSIFLIQSVFAGLIALADTASSQPSPKYDVAFAECRAVSPTRVVVAGTITSKSQQSVEPFVTFHVFNAANVKYPTAFSVEPGTVGPHASRPFRTEVQVVSSDTPIKSSDLPLTCRRDK